MDDKFNRRNKAAFSNFFRVVSDKTHFYTKEEITKYYLKECVFYISVQDVDMFSTIHSKPKTFAQRFKNKFYVWYKLLKSEEQSRSS